jgi:hypothetical protein
MVRWFSNSTNRRAGKRDGRIVFRTNLELGTVISAIVHGATGTLDRYGERGYQARWINHPFPIGPLEDLQRWLALQSAETGRA